MTSARLDQQVRFILEVDQLKEIFRQTINWKSRRAENDAEHSWALCLCAIVLAEYANDPRLDLLRVLKMVIIHDLVEIDAGDTYAYDAARMADQSVREMAAADRIFGMLPPDQTAGFRALWDEFEARATPEARFAHAVDRFQPMLLNWKTEGVTWQSHGVTHDRVLQRMAAVADGAKQLWEKALELADDAVANGHLAPKPTTSPGTNQTPDRTGAGAS
jgi:putative hydrolase of HD superfamily